MYWECSSLVYGHLCAHIVAVASAVHYLHNKYEKRAVHRDLKANNIMLDSNLNARLGDFGLARALDTEKTSYKEAKGVSGTMGYIALECFHMGKATEQCDIYAFGAVLLEVLCGLRPGTEVGGFQFLVDWVWHLHREGRSLDAVDKRLGKDYVVEEAERVLLLGLACSHSIASERPQTQAIVQIISGSVAVPHVPPFKPAFMWSSMPMGLEDISQATTTMTDTSLVSQLIPYPHRCTSYPFSILPTVRRLSTLLRCAQPSFDLSTIPLLP
ncbi:putative L-type lectin-domain containing receptor kinase S.5 [Camellia lanceoleosa]|uniref:L-type lectin-domain containing receptor kinase S.5 n=1 Tax=Camellia lanceoleosa TaxID=1840588 RepID=A0ACC0I2J5_9ERIC|nr:putative L-type lectin-domain containing receptor kinase S.5 [Camellia lanceoleosa]